MFCFVKRLTTLRGNGARETICRRIRGKKDFRGSAKLEDYIVHGIERGVEAPVR
jgi:hypothetical protein